MTIETTASVLHRAAGYDFLIWLITGGRERRRREHLLSFARLQHGESVLDAGCGTGLVKVLEELTVVVILPISIF